MMGERGASAPQQRPMPRGQLVELRLRAPLQLIDVLALRALDHLVERLRALVRVAPTLGLEATPLDRLLQLRLVECHGVAESCEECARVLPTSAVGGVDHRALAVL